MAQKSPIIALLSLPLLLVLLHSCHCDQNLIKQTCQKTPFPALCASSLGSDGRSASADLRGLARIMVDVINAKATSAQSQIKALLKNNPNPKLKQALSSCADKYNAIIVADVHSARQAVDTGDYKFAVDGANDAAGEANNCETAFGGNSPITAMNKEVNGVSVITSAIVRMLM